MSFDIANEVDALYMVPPFITQEKYDSSLGIRNSW